MLCFATLLLLAMLAACTSGGAFAEPTAVSPTPAIDEATGLELNPSDILDVDFVVQGTITAVDLIPQDEPLIKIETPTGKPTRYGPSPFPKLPMRMDPLLLRWK